MQALTYKAAASSVQGAVRPAARCAPVSVPRLPTRGCRRARTVEVAVAQQGSQQVQERWESQVRDGRVRNISSSDVAGLQKEGWIVLDVRPVEESSRAPVANGVHVPLFVADTANDPAALIKKATDFAMGSWWLGGTHYVPNTAFLAEVQNKIPKDARVIVACQKGLRSLAACEQLARAGYQQLAWINGGFDTARKGDIATSNGVDVRYGGIGGLSEAIGWTEVQREESKASFLGGLDGVIKVFSFILVADLLLFAYEQITYWQSTGTGPFGGQ